MWNKMQYTTCEYQCCDAWWLTIFYKHKRNNGCSGVFLYYVFLWHLIIISLRIKSAMSKPKLIACAVSYNKRRRNPSGCAEPVSRELLLGKVWGNAYNALFKALLEFVCKSGE